MKLTQRHILQIADREGINLVTDERKPDNATIISFARAIEYEATIVAMKRCEELCKMLAEGNDGQFPLTTAAQSGCAALIKSEIDKLEDRK